MTVTRVWKRIHCPKCGALIRVRLATDGTWILQDSKPTLHLPQDADKEDGPFTEAQENRVREIIKQGIKE